MNEPDLFSYEIKERRQVPDHKIEPIPFPNEESKWTWIAGLLDAEGSITFQKEKRSLATWVIQVSIFNTNFELLENVRLASGVGRIKIHDGATRTNPIFAYQVSRAKEIQFLLEKITPFLVVKRRRAKLLLPMIPFMFVRVFSEDGKFVRKNPNPEAFNQKMRELFETFHKFPNPKGGHKSGFD